MADRIARNCGKIAPEHKVCLPCRREMFRSGLSPSIQKCVIRRVAEWQAKSDPIGRIDELSASLQYRLGVTDALRCRHTIPALPALPRTTSTGVRRHSSRNGQTQCSGMISGGEGARLDCSASGDPHWHARHPLTERTRPFAARSRPLVVDIPDCSHELLKSILGIISLVTR
jgi:hypothetical protein